MQQIRLTKTPEIEKVLAFLQRKYHLLSEAEVIKVALSEKYHKEKEETVASDQLRKTWEELKVEGKKLGDKLLAEKGLKRENLTEEEFYDIVLNSHHHDA